MFNRILKGVIIAILVVALCSFLLFYTLFAIGNIDGVLGALAAVTPEIIIAALAIYFLKR